MFAAVRDFGQVQCTIQLYRVANSKLLESWEGGVESQRNDDNSDRNY